MKTLGMITLSLREVPMSTSTKPRTTGETKKLEKPEFTKRFEEYFYDPDFDEFKDQIAKLTEVAWKNYQGSHKAPRTVKAGPGFADPNYDLSIEWKQTSDEIKKAQKEYEDKDGKSRILLVVASDRNDQTCPGEISKSSRLAEIAKVELETQGMEVKLLDLSLITSEFGKQIHPCKGCLSTAMPLCHWPCSCYPNHSLGQVHDWMNEIYPMWVRAHGVLIISPVYWHQAPSALKLMIDRLVCADGGNPDPTSTHGKKAEEAKVIEEKGWDYPRHLEGRVYGIITHGDVTGATGLKDHLASWLDEMNMIPAGHGALLERYIGYMEPYFSSHEALDKDEAIQKETKNVAKNLGASVKASRRGLLDTLNLEMEDPRPK
jgi:multimeric flavodoxin WrbA